MIRQPIQIGSLWIIVQQIAHNARAAALSQSDQRDVRVNGLNGLVGDPDDTSDVIGAGSDLVAWDSVTDMLFTAESGSDTVSAITRDGAPVWTTSVSGAIADLEVSSARGTLFVRLENADLTGSILMLDVVTGELLSSANTVSAARDLELSGDGHTVAAAVAGQVHYLRVQ